MFDTLLDRLDKVVTSLRGSQALAPAQQADERRTPKILDSSGRAGASPP